MVRFLEVLKEGKEKKIDRRPKKKNGENRSDVYLHRDTERLAKGGLREGWGRVSDESSRPISRTEIGQMIGLLIKRCSDYLSGRISGRRPVGRWQCEVRFHRAVFYSLSHAAYRGNQGN